MRNRILIVCLAAFGLPHILARDGDIVYEKDWGYADLESKSLIHSKSQYYIASITKIFTSTAVLMLEKQGQLSIHDPITKYLKELPACFKAVSNHFHQYGGFHAHDGDQEQVEPVTERGISWNVDTCYKKQIMHTFSRPDLPP